jgi:hypothetical protein
MVETAQSLPFELQQNIMMTKTPRSASSKL